MTPSLSILRSVSNPQAPTPSALLRQAQGEILSEQATRPALLARLLFATLDVLYGRGVGLERMVVLEIVARVPYQAWENVGYVAISHTYAKPARARRIFEYVRESREQQDNEQWHLLIIEELAQKHGLARSWLLFRFIPQLLALFYYHVSWLLYVIEPRRSYALNADFEDHAQRVYLRYVAEHPELEAEPWHSEFAADYGSYATVADLLRRIALDERVHRDESLARTKTARFDAPRSASNSGSANALSHSNPGS